MLDQKKSLKEYGVKDGDMVMMDRMLRPGGGAGGGAPRPAAAGGGAGAGGAPSWDFSRIQIPTNLLGSGSPGASRQPQPQAR